MLCYTGAVKKCCWNASLYRSLRTNTSKHTLAFSDFLLPKTAPDFPNHNEVLQYLCDYAAHFGLHTYIRLNTVVETVEPAANEQWKVRACTGEKVSTESYEAVVVCCGRDRYPELVHPPGSETFSGRMLHSSSYKGPEEFAGKRIVVAGVGSSCVGSSCVGSSCVGSSCVGSSCVGSSCVGSSCVDIATDLSKVADQLYLSTEHGAWFIPRYVLNRPYDHHLTRLVEWLPYRLRMFLFLRLLVFEYKRMGITLHQLQARGLPLPTFDIWNARLTPCNDLLQRIMSGAIQVKPRMTRLEGQQVYFANGSAVEADVVISCTGYTLRPGGSSGHLQRSTTGLMSLERSSRITLIEVKDCKSLSSRRGSGSKILS